ncbi:Mis12 protein-domain-containing protein [Mycena metata]|uniref:Mis12 protein-domain-containing protein n=1 Tax=Mycena metata TaxID=1033252 RepID=A0AAD7ITS5_9AGAR|nr:Mis12 protein-domain-containing protein [Mycena metata]
MGNSDAPQKLIPPQLLTEALGFSPQLLLDDIINVANLAVQDGVNGTEDFLQQRAAQLGEMDGTQEIEQGLVAFQTLLEFHTDVAFDFFEAWSLRNIFAVPADLPLVLPHHEHLDPTHTPEREQELIDEVEKLRNQLENQRKLKRQLIRASHRKNIELVKAQELFNSLAAYEGMDAAKALPTALLAMQKSIATLPKLEPATISALSQLRHTEAGKRQWEMGKTGYINWAISQLLVKAKEDGGDELLPDVANAEMFRRASAAMDEVTRDLDGVEDVAMED